jgi:RHS repeat-associated protein
MYQGRKQATTYGEVVIVQSYDVRGQLQEVRSSLSGQVLGKLVYGYDGVGNKTSTTTYNGIGGLVATGTNTFEYDDEDRVGTVKNGTTTLATYGYNQNGSLETVTRPNFTTTYSYTGRNELWWLRHANAGTSLGEAQGFAYEVDGSGKRSAIHDGTQTTWNGTVLSPSNPNTGGVRYTFDLAGRLTHESYPNGRLIVYTFDKVGNRLTRAEQANGSAPVLTTTYTYDGNDRLTQETKPDGSVIQYDYDENGNLTMARNYTAASVYEKRVEYFYTFTGRLAMQRHYAPGSLMAASSVILYNYDGDGNRVSVNRTSYDVSSGQVTGFTAHYYQVDATQPYAEVVQEWEQVGTPGSALTLVARYDIGLDRLRMLRLTQPATGPPVWLSSWYAFDGLGSTRSLLDDSGNGTDLWGYADAFGVPTRLVGSTANAFLFNGQQWDANEELYFLRARYYQANKGRFIGQDTEEGYSESPITLHRYLYAGDDPVNFIDPSGESFLSVTLGGFNSLGSRSGYESTAIGTRTFISARLQFYIAISALAVVQAMPLVDAIPFALPSSSTVKTKNRRPRWNIVYRGIADVQETDDVLQGRGIKGGDGGTTPTQHILGVKHRNDPWISTSREFRWAFYWATDRLNRFPGNPVVIIDLKKLTYPYLDVSNRARAAMHLRHRQAINFASKFREVLIKGGVNPEAIIGYIPIPDRFTYPHELIDE